MINIPFKLFEDIDDSVVKEVDDVYSFTKQTTLDLVFNDLSEYGSMVETDKPDYLAKEGTICSALKPYIDKFNRVAEQFTTFEPKGKTNTGEKIVYAHQHKAYFEIGLTDDWELKRKGHTLEFDFTPPSDVWFSVTITPLGLHGKTCDVYYIPFNLDEDEIEYSINQLFDEYGLTDLESNTFYSSNEPDYNMPDPADYADLFDQLV